MNLGTKISLCVIVSKKKNAPDNISCYGIDFNLYFVSNGNDHGTSIWIVDVIDDNGS